MPTLSVEQLAAWMQKAGPFGVKDLGVQVYDDGTIKVVNETAKAAAIRWLDTAVAICMQESTLNTNARNGTHYGLWQISAQHDKEIQFQSKYWQGELGTEKPPNIFHPAVNCGVANSLYNASGWKPWESSYGGGNGAYRKYIGKGYGKRAWEVMSGVGLTMEERKKRIQALQAEHESAVLTGQLAGMVVPGGVLAGNVDAAISDPWGWIAPFLKEAGVTIGVFILGLVVFVLGAWFLISNTRAGTAVKSAVKKAVPVA